MPLTHEYNVHYRSLSWIGRDTLIKTDGEITKMLGTFHEISIEGIFCGCTDQ